MVNSAPRVSVLMTVFNGLSYLAETIDSILNQTYTDLEFIIFDDRSTESGVWETLTKYAEKDQRIRLFRNEENMGQTKSLNKGLKLAKGEYIARQDADDISLPDRFEQQVALLDRESAIVFVSSEMEFIDSNGCSLGTTKLSCDPDLVPWYLLFYNYIQGHSQVMFRREQVISLGGYSESFYSPIQDYELWSRLVKSGKCAIIPSVLLKLRKHGNSFSSGNGGVMQTCMLHLVGQNLKPLLGREISSEEAKELKRFWTGSWWNDNFPDIQRISSLNSRLKEIYQAFLQQNIYQADPHSDLSRKLRTAIGKQFIQWMQTPLSRQHNLLDKLRISLYAFAWYPTGVPIGWLKWFVRLPSQTLNLFKSSLATNFPARGV